MYTFSIQEENKDGGLPQLSLSAIAQARRNKQANTVPVNDRGKEKEEVKDDDDNKLPSIDKDLFSNKLI